MNDQLKRIRKYSIVILPLYLAGACVALSLFYLMLAGILYAIAVYLSRHT